LSLKILKNLRTTSLNSEIKSTEFITVLIKTRRPILQVKIPVLKSKYERDQTIYRPTVVCFKKNTFILRNTAQMSTDRLC